MSSYKVAKPTLSWDENGAPHSDQFDDVYFDRHSGLEETRFVFLEHNNLTNRFAQLFDNEHFEASLNGTFTIAETGFGTGLNFLCAWQLWQQLQQTSQPTQNHKKLHFISVEKYPLSKEELVTALCMWPDLQPLTNQLIEAYPTLCKGLHRIELDNNQVQLTLWFGDANEGFDNINGNVDAWFLDGFAPSKNPDMWNDLLFRNIQRLSHKNTSFSTFTAAGVVRRGLQSAGFDVQKVKGFGKKREMLTGQLTEQPYTLSQRATSGLAWFNNRAESQLPSSKNIKVLVIGAGLAGCHTANAIAKKGIQVAIWDEHDQVANEASGNPQGILYPKLAGHDSPLNRFYLASYLYANRTLNKLEKNKDVIWQQSGLEQRPTSETERQKFETLLAEKVYPDDVLKRMDTSADTSLWLPLSGWVRPALWCQHLIQHENIQFFGNTRLTSLTHQQKDSTDSWQATANNGQLTELFSHVVFCTANHNDIVTQFIDLPTKAIRGQVSSLILRSPCDLDKVLCQNGYVSPPMKTPDNKDAILHFGSSYGLKDTNPTITDADHESNLLKLSELLPTYDWQGYSGECQGRVSFRCTVTDYAPIIGPIPKVDTFINSYKKLSKNAKWLSENVTPHMPNLYINIGHGSRGLISTPLAGEYIASLINNETSVYERKIEHVIHPARFLVRQLKKGKL